jgi:hypothetical protein
MAFYELRQYKVKPGKLAEWVKIMEEEIIPFQISKGMVICGSFGGEEDETVYIWLRRFESEEQRKELYEMSPRVPDYIDREQAVITRMIPTSKSTMQ